MVKCMFKYKSLTIIICIVFLIAFPMSVKSDEFIETDQSDFAVIQKIYNKNSNILNWDLNNPLSIENAEWKSIGNTYHLTSLDLSDTAITGKVDLSQCQYLEDFSFSSTDICDIVFSCFLNKIPEKAFENCAELEYINIPENINLISDSAFKNCSNLKSVIINGNNTSIGSNAFSGCIELKCINNAGNITSVGRNAFLNCSNLIFYGSNLSAQDSAISRYINNMGYAYSENLSACASGYVSKMHNGLTQVSNGQPYKLGQAYLYNEDNVLLGMEDLSANGQFIFSELSIGHRYKVVIDGEFAIARAKYFIVSDENTVISDFQNPIPVVTCDFNYDGIVDAADLNILFSKCAASGLTDEEKDTYDLNGDYYVNSSDTSVIFSLIAYFRWYYD